MSSIVTGTHSLIEYSSKEQGRVLQVITHTLQAVFFFSRSACKRSTKEKERRETLKPQMNDWRNSPTSIRVTMRQSSVQTNSNEPWQTETERKKENQRI
jgi:hypothetical protein